MTGDFTSRHLQLGRVYSRHELRSKFDISDKNLDTAVFQPKRHKSVWLFSSADKEEHRDRMIGNVLDMAGQPKGRKDHLIIDHQAHGNELLVFFRERKDQYPNYGFRYYGRFRYVSHAGSQPARFRLEAIDDLTKMVAEPVIEYPVPRLVNPVKDLARIYASVSEALRDSYLSFGSDHDNLVRSFLASLTTKRFVILTGMSGSGKTQIALRFGEWLGQDRSLVVAVRPDWTGSEALFGYEDALQQPESDGRRPWFVPAPLAFMLKAASDPDSPYLLVLDEMNLAHVERYFADVLSGMESGQPCLPNLAVSNGKWLPVKGAPERIPYPENLFVVGTVNVDETTYMFSPKVLDRANTFEFRVRSGDLLLEAKKPLPCAPGKPELVTGFLELAKDQEWHLANRPDWLEHFAAQFRRVHELLGAGGFEFGHRVFYEAIRFAALAAAAGVESAEEALDLQVLQKVLPRLHGTRKRLEPTLIALGRFCLDLAPDGSENAKFDPLTATSQPPKLRRSFDKVRRMTEALRANQFASFTE